MALKPARGLWPRCRRALYWTHRWLGVAGCLLFAMWFFSGIVMMYVAFPALTDDERIAGLPALDLDAAVVGPAEAMTALPAAVRDRLPRRLVLEAIAAGPQAGPIWRILDADGERHAISGVCMVSAVTGLVIGILRLRVRDRYRDGRMIPYRGWFAWHHVAGLVGGVFVLTWLLSLAGLVVSVSGVVIGWRRLRKDFLTSA